MEMEYVVIVDSYKWSKWMVENLRNLGYGLIHVLSTRDLLPMFQKSSTYDPKDYFASYVYNENLEHITDSLKGLKIHAVIPGIEPGVRLANLLGKKLKTFSANPTEKLMARIDKYQMKQAIAAADLKTTAFFKADNCDEILDWINSTTSYPVVLKPLASCATDGVFVCANEIETRQAFNRILNTVNFEGRRNSEVLAEAFLKGTEFIVNTVSCQKRHYVTDVWECKKRLINGINQYDRELLLSSSSDVAKELSNYVLQVLNALNIEYGACHTEVMLTAEGPVIIETGARVGGNINTVVHENVLTISQAQLNLYAFTRPDLFDAATKEPYKHKAELLHVLLANKLEGIVSGIPLENTIKSLSSFNFLSLSTKPGDLIEPTTTLFTKPGDVWLAHEKMSVIEQDYHTLVDELVPQGFTVNPVAKSSSIEINTFNTSLTHPILSVMDVLNSLPEQYPQAISLASGRPADEFCKPSQEINEALQTFTQYAQENALSVDNLLGQYTNTRGFITPIIMQHLAIEEDIHTESTDIIITSGFQEGAELCIRTLFGQNDVLLVPDPIFMGITGSAIMSGVSVKPIPCTYQLDLKDLENAILELKAENKNPKALYVIPDFSNPHGSCMDLKTRQDLLILAKKYNLLILEDNAYSLVRYEGEKIPSLKALDQHHSVIYLGTFAKSLYPSVRAGYVVVSQKVSIDHEEVKLIDFMIKVKSLTSVNTPGLTQAIVAGTLLKQSFSLKEYNKTRIETYRQCRDIMLQELERHFPKTNSLYENISWNKPMGGFFITLSLPFSFDSKDVIECAQSNSVIVFPLSLFSLQGNAKNQIRLAFTNVLPEKIPVAIKSLAIYLKKKCLNNNVLQSHVRGRLFSAYSENTLENLTDKVSNDFPQLREIHLQAKQLTSNDNFLAFARSLKNNTSVKIVHLENNQITDDVVEIIAENSHIEAIYLNNNKITAKAVLALSKMKSLKILSLNGNSIGQEGFQALANSSIEVLHVRSTGITASGLNALIANTHIKAIFAGNTHIDCNQLNASLIETASHLAFLELSACQLSNSDLHIILKLPNLLGLDVSVNHLTDPCVKELTTHPSLKVLSAGGNAFSKSTVDTFIESQLYRVNIFSDKLDEECISRMERKNEGQNFTSWQTYELTCEYKTKSECAAIFSNIN